MQEERQQGDGHASIQAPFRVGCALLPKKVSRYLTPAMKSVAEAQGLELATIDYTQPLEPQGPFHAIVHKLRPNEDWERNLHDYAKRHPQVAIIDSVDGIRTVQNRSTMLSPLQGDGILIQRPAGQQEHCTASNGGPPVRNPPSVCVQAPTQVAILEGTTLSEAIALLEQAGLHPPLLVKPLWTDGREGSHGLAVLHDLHALELLLSGEVSPDLQPPLVVQQFVEHGGVLYKVYVLGGRTVVSTRPSLGENYLGKDAKRKGFLQLPRISCKPRHFECSSNNSSCLNMAGLDSTAQQLEGHTPGSLQGSLELGLASLERGFPSSAELPAVLTECPEVPNPPTWVTHSLATVLRDRLGMQLFNFDLIKPEGQKEGAAECYYVIDINYFPGVDKIPDFEAVFVDFLKAACTGQPQQYPQAVLNCAGTGQSPAPAAHPGSRLELGTASSDEPDSHRPVVVGGQGVLLVV